MTAEISKDLLLSILAMDSYNRGYGACIADTPDPDSLGKAGKQVGAARILDKDLPENSPAYDVDTNQIGGWDSGIDTVISYCGVEQVCIWKAAA